MRWPADRRSRSTRSSSPPAERRPPTTSGWSASASTSAIRRLPRHRRPHGGGRRRRLAVRGRRRQRPGAAHPHGQVPGADRRRRDRRARRGAVDRRARATATSPTTTSSRGGLHRPAGRVGRAHRGDAPASAGIDVRDARVRHRLGRGRERCCATTTSGGRSSSSTAPRDTLVGATFVGPDVAELLHAATIAIVGEVTARDALARGAVLPDGQRDLAAAARGSQLIAPCLIAWPATARSRPPTAPRRRCASRPAPRAARAGPRAPSIARPLGDLADLARPRRRAATAGAVSGTRRSRRRRRRRARARR